MKTLMMTTALLVVFAVQTNAQETPKAEMTFQKEVHDYGDIKQGSDGTCEFKFTNTGSVPLIISDAKGSCNCTVPTWPKQPIKPGETAVIKVKYGTERIGPINKTVTITANIEGASKILRIKGTVLAADSQGAPVRVDDSGGFKQGFVLEKEEDTKDAKKSRKHTQHSKPGKKNASLFKRKQKKHTFHDCM